MTISSPKVSLNIIPAGGRVENAEQRVLFVGQMIITNNDDPVNNPQGTFDSGDGTLVTNVPDDENENFLLYGNRSMIASMLSSARKVNPITRFDAFVLPETSTDAAIGKIKFNGTATENSQLIFTIGSLSNHVFTLNLIPGDTGTVLGEKIKVLVNADRIAPAYAGAVLTIVNTTEVELIAANRGEEANRITLKIIKTPIHEHLAGNQTHVSAPRGFEDCVNRLRVHGSKHKRSRCAVAQ